MSKKKQNISAIEIAKRVGCTDRAISHWKYGKRNMSLQMAEKILNVLGYELDIRKRENGGGEDEGTKRA